MAGVQLKTIPILMPKNKKDIANCQAVIMGHSETALSVARSLGRRGINVVCIGSNPSFISRSRYMTYVKEPRVESESERLNFYLTIGKKCNFRPVILPTFDPNVIFLSRYREILQKYFSFILPPYDLITAITSKSGFIDIARKHNIALPDSIEIETAQDLKNIQPDFFPCVIKPESQHSWLTERASTAGIFGLKAIPAHNADELRSRYNRVKQVDQRVLIQKMIVGPDKNHLDYHALVDENGKTKGEFVGKKYRLTPPHFGMGCYVESVKSENVVKEGRRILKGIDYKGIANINFKKDERDGRLYFLELNPRFSFWTGLDVKCGVDLPYYYFKACRGEKFSANQNYIVGKRWISLYHDLKGVHSKAKDGYITWWQWIKSVVKSDSEAVFAMDDPAPWIVFVYRVILAYTKKFTHQRLN